MTLSRAIAALLVALTLVVPSLAHAAVFAIIDQISTVDARGAWHPAAGTTHARVQRAGESVAVKVGLELLPGDRVVTDVARVRVRLAAGQDISISEHSDLEIGERTVIQRLGDAYYRVRGAFTVQDRSVETSVEGTEFAVTAGLLTVVTVAEGRVRVRNGVGDVYIRPGQVVEMPQTGAPAPVRFDPSLARSAAAKTFKRGAPTLQLGALLTGGFANGGGVVEGRFFARYLLVPGVRLAFDTGIGPDGAESGIRLPQGLGLELVLGGVSVGGQLLTTVETCNFECGGAYVALHIGGVGSLRYSLTLSRHLSLEGVVRAGYADGLVIDGAFGIGVSL